MREWIIGVICLFAGMIIACLFRSRNIQKSKKYLEKYKAFYWCLIRFVKLKQHGLSFDVVLKDKGITSVAIYGMKELGELILYELKGSSIEVKYAIDREADSIYADIPIYKPNDSYDKVDMVIVTVLTHNRSLLEELREKYDWKVVTINEVLGYFDWDKIE